MPPKHQGLKPRSFSWAFCGPTQVVPFHKAGYLSDASDVTWCLPADLFARRETIAESASLQPGPPRAGAPAERGPPHRVAHALHGSLAAHPTGGSAAR